MPKIICNKIELAATKILKNKSELIIATLGLTFKPNIDDLRESPAMVIAKKIEFMGFKKSYLCEPHIKQLPSLFNPNESQLVKLDKALAEADIFVLLVDHDLFKKIGPKCFSRKACC
jgi:UDP-N-acetyl-D-mannosaminuronic acid dehydrogenase